MDPETASGAQSCAPEPKTLGPAPAPEMEPPIPAPKSSRVVRVVKLDELPPPGVVRWVIRRKAQVVAAVQAGAITVEEVCSRYSISVEEFESWKVLFERHGVYGLRSTRWQLYRREKPGKAEGK
jgi:hypothetical protein